MVIRRRWDPVISNQGDAAEAFFRGYFGSSSRHVLLVCGGGFDPRSPRFAKLLDEIGVARTGLLIRETRLPDPALKPAADSNVAELRAALPNHSEVEIQIFDQNAVVGGRNVVKKIQSYELSNFTDVIVDLSALSVGTAFPLIRFFVEVHDDHLREAPPWNLHVVAVHNSSLDNSIRGTSSYEPDYIHGFKGDANLSASSEAARLWLPQLAPGLTNPLASLHKFIRPDDTCPILPFPSSDPRAGDDLLNEYDEQLSSSWEFDSRNVLLAAEDDPADLYRALVTLNSLRSEVFRTTGGSRLFLSPLGSKVTALGALMAALEEDLPVAYVEAGGYSYSADSHPAEPGELIHVWLEGDVYPRDGRPRLGRAVVD